MPKKKHQKAASPSKYPALSSRSENQNVSNAASKNNWQKKLGSAPRESSERPISKTDNFKSRAQHSNAQDGNEYLKYKSRGIESNWARYEEEPIQKGKIIADSDLRNTGADFASLISQSGTDTSVFRFKNEADWDKDSRKDIQATEDSEEDTVLSMDLESIAECLTVIPMFQKLKLLQTLELLDKDDFNWCGDYLESKKLEEVQVNAHGIKKDEAANENTITSGWCFKGVEEYQGSISECILKLQKEIARTKNTEREMGNFHESIKNCEEEATSSLEVENLQKSRETPGGGYNDSFLINADKTDNESLGSAMDEEDELDLLLSMSLPQTGKVCENDEATDVSQKTNKHELEDKMRDPKSSATELETAKADDLEDWLDSILD